jgi:glucosylceramidase
VVAAGIPNLFAGFPTCLPAAPLCHRARVSSRTGCRHFAILLLLGFCQGLTVSRAADPALRGWITTEDLQQRHAEIAGLAWSPAGAPKPDADRVRIVIDPTRTFQSMLGIGASLESTTCSNFFRLPPQERERVMDRLISPTSGIGMNLMRVCIGTSDFTGEPWYSYCDLPPGQKDPELAHFSIEKDRAYILPVLQLARRRNPDLLFFASPWSPPGWMKSTGTMIGGQLLPEWYPAYAQYFVRFIQAYEAEGIPIHAVTVQNEPGVDRAKATDPKWHYPSCHWTGEQERDFIRDHLGPALRRAGLKTRIWCYDHNYNLESKGDDPGLPYPRAILSDSKAAAFVDGVAFHGYVGDPEGMTQFHSEFPKVPIHFTEGSVFTLWGAHDLIQRFRNWASSYNAWVIMLDDQGRPNNGPFPATHATLKLHSNTLRVEELFEFHNYGHFSKFVKRGAVRVASDPATTDLNHVAFRNPDGTHVLIMANTTKEAKIVSVEIEGRRFETSAPERSVQTLVW